jgi:hypothetical protein
MQRLDPEETISRIPFSVGRTYLPLQQEGTLVKPQSNHNENVCRYFLLVSSLQKSKNFISLKKKRKRYEEISLLFCKHRLFSESIVFFVGLQLPLLESAFTPVCHRGLLHALTFFPEDLQCFLFFERILIFVWSFPKSEYYDLNIEKQFSC